MQPEISVDIPDVSELKGIRSGILLFLQDPDSDCDLRSPIEQLRSFGEALPQIADLASDCISQLERVSQADRKGSETSLRTVLDKLAIIEAALLDDPTGEDLAMLSAFIDESFDQLTHSGDFDEEPDILEPELEGFEIDDETLEIFRAEASELLSTISANLIVLAEGPTETEALWEMQRAVHTLKGAAGVVGMIDASHLAHRIEDLLGQLADRNIEINESEIELLKLSVSHLRRLSEGAHAENELDEIFQQFDILIQKTAPKTEPEPAVPSEPEPANEPIAEISNSPKLPAPVVRVSLDRLYELQTIARDLASGRTALAERLDEFAKNSPSLQASFSDLQILLAQQLGLANELQEKLEQIRMVRFGMLVTRLNRAVHVTCHEEEKKAELIVKNKDVELDTQIIDALVEPLLHLLRNAVVHGIEPPEMRRMIGKPERATITIDVARADSQVIVSVSDNGRGVTISKLKEKALSSGTISQQLANSMTDEEALDLMFLRGVTTAENLSLNAGRGIGMSIVREGVESRGGSITIHSEPQKGTVFMIHMPTNLGAPQDTAPRQSQPETISLPQIEVLRAEPVKVPKNDISVLIVDDSAVMRQTMSKVVERAGWKAFSATEGGEALQFLKKAQALPDIIITDLEMPGLGGMGFIEALKCNPQLFDIPVIMVTSRNERVHREKAFALGAAKFLTKPIESGELKSIINSLCVVKN